MSKIKFILFLLSGLFLSPGLLAQEREVYRIGIPSFESDKGLEVNHLPDIFATELLKVARASQKKKKVSFKILNRSQIAKILKESEFQASGLTEEESAIQIGKLLNARYLILGQVTRTGDNTISYALTVIDAQTGEYLGGDSVTVGAARYLVNQKQNEAMAKEIINFIMDPDYVGRTGKSQRIANRFNVGKSFAETVKFRYGLIHFFSVGMAGSFQTAPRVQPNLSQVFEIENIEGFTSLDYRLIVNFDDRFGIGPHLSYSVGVNNLGTSHFLGAGLTLGVLASYNFYWLNSIQASFFPRLSESIGLPISTGFYFRQTLRLGIEAFYRIIPFFVDLPAENGNREYISIYHQVGLNVVFRLGKL